MSGLQATEEKTAVNAVVATTIAATVANTTELAVAPSVASLAISTQIESELPESDDTTITKPAIIQVSSASRNVENYKVQEGDTIDSIADRFGISTQTIKWANDMTSDRLTVGSTLKILPRDGILYTVKADDTVEKLADKYKADASIITTYNDLEISGVTEGLQIVIPDGILPTTERPGYTAPVSVSSYSVGYSSGFNGSTWRIKIGTPMYSGNKYAYGNCTAYAYDRRVELGLAAPVSAAGGTWGNATTWDNYASGDSRFTVSNVPSVGAIIQNDGGYGHVGIVEEVLPNGDIKISEMNAYVSGGGWNIVSGRTLPAANVGQYAYIR